VESRSTRFLGKIPSFAILVSVVPIEEVDDMPGSILPVVALSGLPTPGLFLPPICCPDRLLCAGTGSSDTSARTGHGYREHTISITRLPSTWARPDNRLSKCRCSSRGF
jgi:hypothetical protein